MDFDVEINALTESGKRYRKVEKWVVDICPRNLRLILPSITEFPFPIQDMHSVDKIDSTEIRKTRVTHFNADLRNMTNTMTSKKKLEPSLVRVGVNNR